MVTGQQVRRLRQKLMQGKTQEAAAAAAGMSVRSPGFRNDGFCPALLGPALLERLVLRFPGTLVSVSVADWEYESWFIASAESIAEHVGVAVGTEVPDNIEEIQNQKGWLERNILNRRYRETADQASFSSVIDVPLARQRSQSFNRFCLELERLLAS